MLADEVLVVLERLALSSLGYCVVIQVVVLEHEELQTVEVDEINLFIAQPATHARTPAEKSGLDSTSLHRTSCLKFSPLGVPKLTAVRCLAGSVAILLAEQPSLPLRAFRSSFRRCSRRRPNRREPSNVKPLQPSN